MVLLPDRMQENTGSIPVYSFFCSCFLWRFILTAEELFEKEVQPIITMIEDLFVEKKTNHYMSIVALASVLGLQINEMQPNCFMDQLLTQFVRQNIKKILERKIRESN